MIYFKKDGVLHHILPCIIFDNLEHDICFAHELQRIVMLYIKKKLPQIKIAGYFSDSCDGQYRNSKALLNLNATWASFATSREKSPCDEIGSTVKHKILRGSLQRPVNNQILSFCAVKGY